MFDVAIDLLVLPVKLKPFPVSSCLPAELLPVYVFGPVSSRRLAVQPLVGVRGDGHTSEDAGGENPAGHPCSARRRHQHPGTET